MAETLFITPQELIEGTIIGGNVDIDKYITSVANVQINTIEPLLGTELYNKILTDYINDDLTDLYLILFDKYIKPITKNEAAAEYIEIAPYTIDNGGVFKHTTENSQLPTQGEVNGLSQVYHKMAQMFIIRFNKWIIKNDLPEYKTNQDEVNPDKDIIVTFGWQI
jgi:hypothetical protein